ncbi:hypothetical protein HK100_004225, partial [Physocladia obscura]
MSTFKEACLSFMGCSHLYVQINDSLQYDNLTYTSDDSDIWTLLYYAGYLSCSVDGALSIPNLEVNYEWVSWLMPNIVEAPIINSIITALICGDINSGKKAEAFYHAFCLGLFIAARDYNYEVKSNHEGGTSCYDVRLLPRNLFGDSFGVIIEFKVAEEDEDVQDAASLGWSKFVRKVIKLTAHL